MAGEAVLGLVIGAPYFKIIGMARGPIAAALLFLMFIVKQTKMAISHVR
jgi:hypothetical protein